MLSDPKRIEIPLSLLSEIWVSIAQLTLRKLMSNRQRGFSFENEGKGQVTEISQTGIQRIGCVLFYIEGHVFIQFLETKLTQKRL